MSIIHIETSLVARGEYEFIQTWVDGYNNLDERVFTEKHEDRMFAAMTNLGYACRWLQDKQVSRGSVCIVSDRDGKDIRYNGEHDTLFEAVAFRSDYQKNRAKYALIYGKYVKFLDRIRELADVNEIAFTQNQEPFNDIKYNAVEVTLSAPVAYSFKGVFTRANLTKLSLAGTKNTLTCRACNKSIIVQTSDAFTPIRPVGNGRMAGLIKSNKQLVKKFLDEHCKIHGLED